MKGEESTENKNIVIVKHHPRPLNLNNPFYITQCPDIGDRVIINLTSRGRNAEFARQVSPFFVGPVTGPDGANAPNLEVIRQVGKVFPHHDDNGQPSTAYFDYREKMYTAAQGSISKPIMRPPYHEFGYEPEDMCYWAYWNSDKGTYENLYYLEGCKKVYVPEYAKLVANTPAFKWMKSLVDSAKKIDLLDFDGFNYYNEEAMKIRCRAYVLKCKKRKVPVLRTENDFTDAIG